MALVGTRAVWESRYRAVEEISAKDDDGTCIYLSDVFPTLHVINQSTGRKNVCFAVVWFVQSVAVLCMRRAIFLLARNRRRSRPATCPSPSRGTSPKTQ